MTDIPFGKDLSNLNRLLYATDFAWRDIIGLLTGKSVVN